MIKEYAHAKIIMEIIFKLNSILRKSNSDFRKEVFDNTKIRPMIIQMITAISLLSKDLWILSKNSFIH